MTFSSRSDPGYGSGPGRYPGTFVVAFREAAAALGWDMARLQNDVAVCRDQEGKEHLVGVENLFRRARRTSREDWPQLIQEFLKTISAAEVADNIPANLQEVADRLLVRLGHPLKLGADDSGVWALPVDETGLVVNLVIDFPNRMCYVTEELVTQSGKSGEDWLKHALENLMSRTPEDCLQTIEPESGLCVCGVADAYDSSRVLLLERLLPQHLDTGFFVVIPGRDELLIMPVTREALPHVPKLKLIADRNFRKAPYPISNEVFWIHEGQWHLFPIEIQGQEATVQPPPAFVAIMNQFLGEIEQESGEEEETPGEEIGEPGA